MPLDSGLRFEKLVADNQRWLLRYVRKVIGNADTAEDMVQETFIRAFKAYDGYKDTGRQRQWLGTIAHNVCMRYLGSHGGSGQHEYWGVSIGSFDDYACLEDSNPSIQEMVENDELRRRILAAISNLPDHQRNVVFYRYIMDYSVDRVARITGQSPGSVKSKCFYGLRKVRGVLSDYLMAIPARAKNIRIKRGNGVIDAGPYKFAFSERYVSEDESLRIECTYLK